MFINQTILSLMRKLLSYLMMAALVAPMLTSCRSDNGETWAERRISGTWQFDRVFYTPRWSIQRENRLEEYDQYAVTFFDDYTLLVLDTNTDEEYSGTWNLSSYNTTNGESTSTVQVLQVVWLNTVTNEIEAMILGDAYIGERRMSGNENNDEGNYRYRLVKL